MGVTNSSTAKYDLTPHFSTEIHPVEQEVSLFKLRGQSLFLFLTEEASPNFTRVAQDISTTNCPHLCSYHGNLFLN